jgi:hypothetical protein
VLVGVGVLAVILLLRPTRVLALWLLWLIGFVYPDGVPKGASVGRAGEGQVVGASGEQAFDPPGGDNASAHEPRGAGPADR